MEITGHAIATKCGHTYDIQAYLNDMNEIVTRHDAYPDPNAEQFRYDANELCWDCYHAAMNSRANRMTFGQMVNAWNPR